MTTYLNGVIITKKPNILPMILLDGATTGFLNSGKIEMVKLSKDATAPRVMSSISLSDYNPNNSLKVRAYLSHEITGETLDLDLDYIAIKTDENYNTKSAGTTLTNTPTSPGVSYQKFTTVFEIPNTSFDENTSLTIYFKSTSSGLTGDLYLWGIDIYQ